jgi:hypothetical protein
LKGVGEGIRVVARRDGHVDRAAVVRIKMRLADASKVIESGNPDASVKVTPTYSLEEPTLELEIVVEFAISISTQEEPTGRCWNSERSSG